MPTARRSTMPTMTHRWRRRLTSMFLAVFLATAFLAAVPAPPRAFAGGGPRIIVDIDNSRIDGSGWTPNSMVTITMDIWWMTGTVDLTRANVPVAANGTFGEYIGNQYHPQAGDVVTVTDGVHTKTHIVTGIWVAASDEAADTVSGFSAPNAAIDSWVFAVPNKSAYTTADATGRWTIDYGGIWNLMAGTTVGFREYDIDADATQIHLTLPVDPDFDADGIPNPLDNCPWRANATQYDGDADGTGARCDHVDRVWGPDRYWTAAAVSEMAFDTATTVFIALGTNFPDALVAAAAGGYVDAPVLLTGKDSLPPATIAELQRLTPTTAYIVGGTAVIDPVVEQLVGSLVPNVTRLAGPDRYATAAAVSTAIFPPGNQAFLATGEDFPDALVAAAAAGWYDSPVLLTRKSHVPQQTLDELVRLHPSRIYIVGGTAVISDAVAQQVAAIGTVERVAGPNRYATAAAVSSLLFGMNHMRAFLAYGGNFPDALVAAAAGGHLATPVLLVGHDTIPTETLEQIPFAYRENIWLVGGTAVISDAVATAVP